MSQPPTAATPAITTRTTRVWLDDAGILHSLIFPRCEQKSADAEDTVAAMRAVGGGRRRPLLVDARHGSSVDRGARSYFSGPETAKVVSASALLVGSPVSRMVGGFFLGLNRSIVPTRLFTSEVEALGWLHGFLT